MIFFGNDIIRELFDETKIEKMRENKVFKNLLCQIEHPFYKAEHPVSITDNLEKLISYAQQEKLERTHMKVVELARNLCGRKAVITGVVNLTDFQGKDHIVYTLDIEDFGMFALPAYLLNQD